MFIKSCVNGFYIWILNEKVLAKEFGVSRSPIKDVLNRLEWDQFVRVIPRTGSMVTDIEFSKVMNIYQVRFEIEAFEARLAGDQFSSKHISELKNLYENCTKLLDKKNCKALAGIDASLRDIIHDAAGNPILAEVSDRLYSQTFRLWYTVLGKGDWREEVTAVINELEKLLDCFSFDNSKKLGEIRRNQLLSHFERLRHKFLGTTDIPMT
jgi:DNA-binding GntR family transcriptional regulator